MLRELVCVVALASGPAGAVEISANGFLVRHEMTIAAPAAKVYDALTAHIGVWWNAQHTCSGDGRDLSIGLRPGGGFCEGLASGSVEHMRVVRWREDQLLRMSGGLGPLQGSGVAG